MGLAGVLTPKVDKRTMRVTVTAMSVAERLKQKRDTDADEPNALSPTWKDADGSIIDESAQFSPLMVDVQNTDNGYFYLPREKGGFTIYSLNAANFLMFASLPHQFKEPEDASDVCRMLAATVLSPSLVHEAGMKGKGRNAAAIQIYKRNAVRTSSIVDYRNKMRKRQVPLKVSSRWEFFTRMIEDGELSAIELTEAAAYATDIETVRNGGESAYDAVKSKARFIGHAIEG